MQGNVKCSPFAIHQALSHICFLCKFDGTEEKIDFWIEALAGHMWPFLEVAELITSEVGVCASSINCTHLLRGGLLNQN